jgi:hypothetical protein
MTPVTEPAATGRRRIAGWTDARAPDVSGETAEELRVVQQTLNSPKAERYLQAANLRSERRLI